MRRRLIAGIMLLAACGGRYAAADSDVCTITATSVAFGSFTGNSVNVTGTLTVKCTSNVAFSVGLNQGTAAGASITNRSMTGPGSTLLGYKLFSDPSYTQNWGNSSTTGWVNRTYNGNSQSLTVYAQLPGNQAAPGGAYTDTITASVWALGEIRASTEFNVTATVVNACAISTSALTFPAYTGKLLNSTATISITCTNGKTYNVGLNAGTASGATVTKRSMTGPGGALLGYKLFKDSARSINWGNTVGVDTVPGTGTGLAQSLTVYGQIPAAESGPVGTYADTITATITY